MSSSYLQLYQYNELTAAIEFAYLAKEHKVYTPAKMGLVSSRIEKTTRNLARLNNPGMSETDRYLVEIIKEAQSS